MRALGRLGRPIYRGAAWTTDAPFRETAAAIERCRTRNILAVDVAYAPASSEAVFRSLLPAAVRLLASPHAGLGASLFDAAEDLLDAGHEAVCLVNADSPNLPTGLLVEAARALQPPGDRLV